MEPEEQTLDTPQSCMRCKKQYTMREVLRHVSGYWKDVRAFTGKISCCGDDVFFQYRPPQH
jgi:hypothetical protein